MSAPDPHGLRAPRREPRSLVQLWPYLLVITVGSLLLFPGLGSFGLWDPWEPKYAQSAREMLERESFVVPYFLGQVRLTKPILTYWGVIAGYSVFGIGELGARFVGACMALASLVGVLYAVWRMRGRRAGMLAACVLATSPQFLFLARQATPDIYLLTSLGTGLLFFALALHGGPRGRRLHMAIAAAGLALAVLAKGPVIVGAVFGGALLASALAHPEVRRLWRSDSRVQTGRFVIGLAAVLIALGSLGSLAFLFGTSSRWWWYSDEGRAVVESVRDRILTTLAQVALDRILLGLAACGLLVAAIRRRREANFRAGALMAAAAVAAGVVFIEETGTRILIASLLGLALAGWAGYRITASYVSSAGILPRVRPCLRPLGLPLLLFLAIFVALVAPWHIAIFAAQQNGYFTDFLIEHNLARVFKIASQTGGIGFYLPVVLYGCFPWSCLIPIGLALPLGVRRWEPTRRWGFECFLFAGSLVTFVAFSVSTTKFPHYIAPLLIPLAVLIGLTLDSMLEHKRPAVTWAWIGGAALYLAPMFALMHRDGAELLVATFTVKESVAPDVAPGAGFAPLLWILAGLWFLAMALRSRRWAGVAIVTVAAILGGYLTIDFMPRLSRDKTMQALCRVWSEQDQPAEPLGFFGNTKFGVYFYTNRRIQPLDDEAAFLEFMRPDRPAICIVQRTRMRSGRRAYLARYPGHDLHIVESSHRTYATMTNRPVVDH